MNTSDTKRKLSPLGRLVLVLLAVGGFLILAVCAYLCFVFYAADAASLEQGRENASELLLALEKYRQDKGEYPQEMGALVPDYLSDIPRSAPRYEYSYKACANGSGYILYFRLTGANDEWCGYSTGTEEWKCTDSIGAS